MSHPQSASTPHLVPANTPPSVGLSVVVPVFNEQESIQPLANEVELALSELEIADDPSPDWEVVFIDDGSTDRSWQEIQEVCAADDRFRGMRLRRNSGKSAALAAGIRVSRGRTIATLDGDLQDDPAELPRMLSRLGDSADLVAGHKADRQDPIGKRWPSKLFNAITSVATGLKLHDHNCGLKVGRREVFESVPLYGEMHRYFAALSHSNGFKVVEQEVNHRPRQFGRSKFGFERYARGGLDLLTVVALTRYSRRPAHLLGGLGMLLGTLGMIILLYLSGLWVFTDQAIGNRPLLLLGVLLVLVAVQLASLGLLAEMIVNSDALDADPLANVSEWANVAGSP